MANKFLATTAVCLFGYPSSDVQFVVGLVAAVAGNPAKMRR
jgi:hypothetical protein